MNPPIRTYFFESEHPKANLPSIGLRQVLFHLLSRGRREYTLLNIVDILKDGPWSILLLHICSNHSNLLFWLTNLGVEGFRKTGNVVECSDSRIQENFS